MEVDSFIPLALAQGDSGLPGLISTFIALLTTDSDPTISTITLPLVLEYAALATGAVSGAMKASERNLDIIGAVALAMVTGLGGGLLRDIILPTTSIYMLDHPYAVLLCVVLGILAFFFRRIFQHIDTPLLWIDIVSVALFAFSGADKALMADYNAVSCILLGVITAVGGGAVRDVCLGEVPVIFQRGTYYAIAALGGAVAYIGLVEVHVTKLVAASVCVAVTITLRYLSLKYNLQSATSVDLTPRVAKPFQRAVASVRTLHRPHESAYDERREETEVTFAAAETEPRKPAQSRPIDQPAELEDRLESDAKESR